MRWSTRRPAAVAALSLATLAACADAPQAPLDPLAAKGPSDAALEHRNFHAALNEMLRELRKGGGGEKTFKGIKVKRVGRGQLVAGVSPADPPDDVPAGPGGGAEDPDDYGREPERMRAFNPVTGDEWEIALSPDLLRNVQEWQQTHGQTTATEGVDDPRRVEGGGRTTPGTAPGLSLLGPSLVIAGGSDTRTVLAPNGVWPWRAIAQFNYGGTGESGCTGTMIGPRHLITAAHCVNKYQTNTWYAFTVTPARSGAGTAPYDSSQISLTPPAGTEAWYFTPAGWRDPNSGCNTACDYAIIVIPDRLGDQTGWLGYVARSQSALIAAGSYNRGYPSCTDPSPSVPSGCQTARMYGDANQCGLGDFGNAGSNGWARTYKHDCDTSPGHSGSSLYHYFFDASIGKTVPVVALVHKGGSPDPGGSTTRPNYGRRLDPVALGVISSLRTTFP